MNIMEFILMHAPALIVAVPLLGAFLTPLISRVNDKLRNVFVMLTLGLTGILILILANDILIEGITHLYVFGGDEITSPVVRIFFEVDAFSIFMAIISKPCQCLQSQGLITMVIFPNLVSVKPSPSLSIADKTASYLHSFLRTQEYL